VAGYRGARGNPEAASASLSARSLINNANNDCQRASPIVSLKRQTRTTAPRIIAVTDGALIAADVYAVFPRATRDDDGGAVDRQLLIPSRAVVEHLVTFVIKSSARLEMRARRSVGRRSRVFLPFGPVPRATPLFLSLSLTPSSPSASPFPCFRGKSRRCTRVSSAFRATTMTQDRS